MKNSIKTIIFILIFLAIIIFLNKLLSPVGTMKEGWQERRPIQELYMQENNTIDTLYVGASSVYCGISPLEVYNINGVTGYTYSSSEQAIWTSYYFMREAFKTQTPKVIFLETEKIFMTKDTQKKLDNRMDMDELKLSSNKIDMINDPIYNLSTYDKFAVICPTIYYHARWHHIKQDDIEKFFDYEKLYKGYIFKDKVVQLESMDTKIKDERAAEGNPTISDEVLEYLKKIQTLCEDNNCELVLISMPYKLTYSQTKNEIVSEYAKENNIDFIDLNDENEIQIDWTKDSLDENGNHLNIYGAEKVGKYLANYISNKFSLIDHREDSAYQEWNDMLNKYKNQKESI